MVVLSKTKSIAGIVLAGGNSRRFGEDKALYKEAGETSTWVEQTAAKMMPLVDHVFVVTNARLFPNIQTLFANTNIEIITDQAPYLDKGPLGGIYAAMKSGATYDRYLLSPTDTPHITTEIFADLIAQGNTYATTKNAKHYLTACIPYCKTELETMLRADNLRIRELLRTLDVKEQFFDTEAPFENKNSK
ncbi:molybdenum cofactor guanylyltransferase [Paenilisteria weihenstephanensis]|uniref:molybdenum cofactor guanylyltransferase n=1 Tax=Listeria weihenstephanensis TaxID=1006155 RepID=UPI0016274597|nr:molybdenum cofactor guanylyltransferase [Listeria weihenstephanensis]